jgi:predicted AlkP superfamily pyrophosphatase or phosphodiesterase
MSRNAKATMSLLLFFVWSGSVRAQAPQRVVAPPRLVVVIAIDQMRNDYLDRFRPLFGSDGFNRFLEKGARYTQARYKHAVTNTCPGHATMLTGAHADRNGIITNEWWDAKHGRIEYCAHDDNAPLVGVQKEGRSPRNLIGSTVGDVLRETTHGQSHVVTVSGKDRSAIMLGGHLADAAYWLEDTLVVTSTYYRPDLPDWVKRFNASGAITKYFGKAWDRVLPMAAYASLGPDDQEGERDEHRLGRTFPHPLGDGEAKPGPVYVGALERSPFQNEIVADIALEAVRNERLGKDSIPDILAISFSANDRVGHAYGPDSHEVLDITVRTDRLLARFFAALDREVGLANTVIVLTADHGVASLPEVVNRLNPNSGSWRLPARTIVETVEAALNERFDPTEEGHWVAHNDNPYLSLDERFIAAHDIDFAEAEQVARDAVAGMPGIAAAYTKMELTRAQRSGLRDAVLLSFHPGRSANIMYTVAPGVLIDKGEFGAEHGTPWSYDQQVPLLWYGASIRPGRYEGEAHVEDIAPTLAALLHIEQPSLADGRVLTEILRTTN